MNQVQTYDAIVVGSGIGGLTVASLLAKINKKRVLILERHSKAGGYTHEFQRKGKFSWDVGLHYVGEMEEKDTPRKVIDFITEKKVEWNKLPDPYDVFVYPDFTFSVGENEKSYIDRLVEMFPHEKKAIIQYFKDVKVSSSWMRHQRFAQIFPKVIQWLFLSRYLFGRNKWFITTEEYLDNNFKDPKLKALLVSQWGDYGVAPDQSLFAVHSVIVHHYLDGAYYPDGGAHVLADSIIPPIEATGGCVLLNRRAKRILIENNKAIGVEVDVVANAHHEQEVYYAPVIISAIGAINTYLDLLPEDVAPELQRTLEGKKLASAVVVYLGLKRNPNILGFKGENYWIYRHYDHEKLIADADALFKGKPNCCFLSFPSLKNKQAEGHTAEIIALIGEEPFKKWQDVPWLKRGEDYQRLKETLAEGLIDLVESQFSGFKNLIEYREVSTPLTLKHFSARWQGNMYGIPVDKGYFSFGYNQVRTPIKGLYLTGGDVFSLGVAGAMMGGLMTAGIINGPWGFIKVLREVY